MLDLETEQVLSELGDPTNHVLTAAFSPDGRQLALGLATGKVQILEPGSWREMFVLSGHEAEVMLLAYGFPAPTADVGSNAPGPLPLATADSDGNIVAWNIRTGSELCTIKNHGERIAQLWFSPDGRLIAASHADCGLMIWDASNGHELLTLSGHTEVALDVAYGAGGHRVVSGSFDGTVRQWEAFPWREEDYDPREDARSPDPIQVLANQARTYAQKYWRNRLSAEDEAWKLRSTPGKTVNPPLEPELLPPPDDRVTANQIDLSAYYTSPFRVPFQPVYDDLEDDTGLTLLPVGTSIVAGVSFDARGIIQLRRFKPLGSTWAVLWNERPDRVEGIPINRVFTRFHLLHGTGWKQPEGTPVASVVLHYADGERPAIQVLYGRHLRDWMFKPRQEEPATETNSRVGWIDSNPVAERQGLKLRLYVTTWDNPRPEVKVTQLDYVSHMTQCAPFLIALTVE